MKQSKLYMLLCIGSLFITGKSLAQANPFINVLPSNSGIVTIGNTIDIEVTIGNTGPISTVPQAKLRPIIQLPASVTFLPNAQQTGLPSGWSILSNSGSQLRLCNNSDPIPVNTSRTITLKAQGVTVAPQQTFSGNINFGNGTTCAAGTSVAGDLITDNSALSTIRVKGPDIVNLTAYLQGYYSGSSTMASVLSNQGTSNPATECDSITVELHEPAMPYATLHSTKAVLNTNGTTSAIFSTNVPPGNYYLVIKHRNTIETWSSNTVLVNETANYNFSTAANQAFGSNQVEMTPGVWAFYSGDIDQNGYLELDDYNLWDLEFQAGFPHSNYTPDLDGNGYVELDDYNIWDGNFQNGIYSLKP